MSESKSNSPGEKVRIPTDLLVELRQEQSTYLARGETAPAQGDLLNLAWRCYKHAAREPASGPIQDDTGIDAIVFSPETRDLLIVQCKRLGVKPDALVEESVRSYLNLGKPLAAPGTLPPQAGGDIVRPNTLPLPPTGPFAQLTDLEHILLESVLRVIRCKKPGLPSALISNILQFEEFRELYERYGDADPLAGETAPGEPPVPGGSYPGISEIERRAGDIAASIEGLRDHGMPGDRRKEGDSRKTRKRGGA
jgi:hypothetical protein